MERQILLEMRNITKAFAKVVANDHVDLQLYQGEIHALLGENGAGKSTLMNILTGIYRFDEGEIYMEGKLADIRSPKDAAQLGIGMVHQNFMLVPTLTVAENISLSMETQEFVLNKAKTEEIIRKFSERFGLQVDPGSKVWQLSIGEQQRVEIMKLLCRESKILILDEPSAVLTPQEARKMFSALRRMADEGKAVIVISHKMNEVMENADRITVLKSGRVEDQMPVEEATLERLTRAVVGERTLKNVCVGKEKMEGKPVLSVEGLCANNDKGLKALDDISFTLRSGEIFAIAGVAGNGQRELAEVLAGLRKATSGKIIMEDADITGTGAKKRIAKGISFIPEDRLHMGLVPQMNTKQNAIMKSFRTAPFSKYGVLKMKAVKDIAEAYIKTYNIRNDGIDYPVSMMSGGNQQKLLVAREIGTEPRVIIAAYPVRGLDIGATNEIHRILMEQRSLGACIFLISEELDEIFEMADRVGVLCNGKIMGVRDIGATNYEEIGRMMSGETA